MLGTETCGHISELSLFFTLKYFHTKTAWTCRLEVFRQIGYRIAIFTVKNYERRKTLAPTKIDREQVSIVIHMLHETVTKNNIVGLQSQSLNRLRPLPFPTIRIRRSKITLSFDANNRVLDKSR